MKQKKEKPMGNCHLCGQYGILTKEHIPPESAFNHAPVVLARQDFMYSQELWDGRGDRTIRRGYGVHTLCEPCNNNTGGMYGGAYCAWAKTAFEGLDNIPAGELRPVFVRFQGKPLRFLKQVITMFFSVNNANFRERHPELVRFVLNKDARGLPPSYKVDLVLVRGGFARTSGLAGSIDFVHGRTVISSEIAHYPFALQLTVDGEPANRLGPIEHFADCGYNEERETWVWTIVGQVVSKFPNDYRSREQITKEAGETQQRMAYMTGDSGASLAQTMAP